MRYWCFVLEYFQHGHRHVMHVLAQSFPEYRDTVRKWLESRGAEIGEEWDCDATVCHPHHWKDGRLQLGVPHSA
jgi:hypothetical protein